MLDALHLSQLCSHLFKKMMELWTRKSYHAAFSEKHLIGSSFILGHDYDPKHTECSENIPGYKNIEPIDLNGIETLLCVNFVFTLAYCISVYYCMFLVNRCFKKKSYIYSCMLSSESVEGLRAEKKMKLSVTFLIMSRSDHMKFDPRVIIVMRHTTTTR